MSSFDLIERLDRPSNLTHAEGRAASICDSGPGMTSDPGLIALAVRCCDLTSLEGSDTEDTVRLLAKSAMDPAGDGSVPSAFAVCVYPRFVRVAAETVRGSAVRVVAAAGSFPSGQATLGIKQAEIQAAVSDGADEIDAVMSWGLFLSGDERAVFDEITALKGSARPARLKVILEAGALGKAEAIRRAALIAMSAGADMIKTSTGKTGSGASPAAALVMSEAIRDWREETGRQVGLKVAGGIRKTEDALCYMTIVSRVLGQDSLTPGLFRIGASTLLQHLVSRIKR
jgi:deoxyribose-phosphate aldolase